MDEDLDFRTDSIPATLPLCQTGDHSGGPVVLGNCTEVCEFANTLLDADLPNNLLTCGLWATLITLDNYSTAVPGQTIEAVHEQYQDVLRRFDTLGLDASNSTYVSATIEAVSTTLFTLLKENRIQTYQSSSIQGPCDQQTLFLIPSWASDTDVPQLLRNCISAIYAPRSLNPDLGGVGVSMT